MYSQNPRLAKTGVNAFVCFILKMHMYQVLLFGEISLNCVLFVFLGSEIKEMMVLVMRMMMMMMRTTMMTVMITYAVIIRVL
jgi:hypothetical protein